MREDAVSYPGSLDFQGPGVSADDAGYPPIARIWGRVQRWFRGLARAPQAGDVVHEFGTLMGRSRSPVELRRGLVRLAGRLTGARQVLLFLEHSAGARLTRVACWPEPSLLQIRSPVSPDDPTRTIITTPEGLQLSRAEAPLPRESSIRLPLRWRGEILGYLGLHGAPDPSRGRGRMLRQLEALCSMAAAARACEVDAAAPPAPPIQDPLTGLHHARFLDAFLAHAITVAARRHEGLSLVVVSPDRMQEIREQMGEAIADAVLQRVARAVGESFRVSDVVARTGRDNLTAVLPAARAADAARVARQVVAVVAEAGLAAPTRFPVTASAGVSGYPDHGETPEVLREAAEAALRDAQGIGIGQVVLRVVPDPARKRA
ncbi:MAG: sensor domain-containing diguanylate cyclase [Isosphaeraceae bacterium]